MCAVEAALKVNEVEVSTVITIDSAAEESVSPQRWLVEGFVLRTEVRTLILVDAC